MNHSHHHHRSEHHLSGRHIHKLRWIFLLTFTYMVIEYLGGLYSGSLALVADAAHMLGDTASIGIALAAAWLARRPAPAHHSFGYDRAETLAAFVNGLLLVGIGIGIFWEAIERLSDPHEVKTGVMLVVAAGGLVINLIAARLLHGEHAHNLNVKGAYFHILSDLLGSAGALVAGLVIMATGWSWVDALIGFIIAVLVINSAIRLVREAGNMLIEGVPDYIDVSQIEREVLAMEGVRKIHNLHVWNISSEKVVLAAHVIVSPEHYTQATLTKIQKLIRENFGLDHATLQLEVE